MIKPKTRQILLLHIIMLIIFAVMIWSISFVAFDDYINHLARLNLAMNYDKLPILARFYNFHYTINPYMGLEIFFRLAHPFFDIYATGKLFVLFSFATIISGVCLVNYQLFGRLNLITLAAYPLLFNTNLAFGFVAYFLAIGFVLIGFALWLWLASTPRRRFFIFLPYCLFLCLIHAFGFTVFALLIGLYELQKGNFKQLALTALQLILLSIAPAILIFSSMNLLDTGVPKTTTFGDLKNLAEIYLGITRYTTSPINIIYLMFLTILALTGFFSSRLKILLILLTLIAAVTPTAILSIWTTQHRIPMLIGFLLIASSNFNTRGMSVLAYTLLCCFTISAALSIPLNYADARKCSAMFDEFAQVVKKLPPGTKLVTVKQYTNYPCGIHQNFDQLSTLGALENQLFVANLITAQPPISVKPEYQQYAARVGVPPSPEELLLGQNLYIKQYIHWSHWQQDFDYLNYMHFNNKNKELTDKLEEVISGSYFTIYKIKK